jgi:hypothetical protein
MRPASRCSARRRPTRLAPRLPLALPGAVLAWGQLAAGGLDAIENLALMRARRVLRRRLAGLAAACAWPKFGLVAGIGYLTWYAVRQLRR